MQNQEKSIIDTLSTSEFGRRDFLKYGGMGTAAAMLFVAGCKKDNTNNNNNNTGVDLGSGDTGILNYAYALEQLEAAFYTAVIGGAYWASASAQEKQILSDIQKHEVGHRDFFKNQLGSNAIQDLQVNFSTINFADRRSVLSAAMTFEDLGVSAYNGAGKLISTAGVAYLALAGKIVSVEARHAAAIRDLLYPKNAATGFAGDDAVDSDGLDKANSPSVVLAAASTYITTVLNASHLPN